MACNITRIIDFISARDIYSALNYDNNKLFRNSIINIICFIFLLNLYGCSGLNKRTVEQIKQLEWEQEKSIMLKGNQYKRREPNVLQESDNPLDILRDKATKTQSDLEADWKQEWEKEKAILLDQEELKKVECKKVNLAK